MERKEGAHKTLVVGRDEEIRRQEKIDLVMQQDRTPWEQLGRSLSPVNIHRLVMMITKPKRNLPLQNKC